MNRQTKLTRLSQMAEMVLTTRSAEFAKSTEACNLLRLRLDALDVQPSPMSMADPGLARRHFAYECWASARRDILQQQLAAQRIILEQREVATKRALARLNVLGKLR